MKTKLAILLLMLAVALGRAQTIYIVDTTTPNTYNGQTIIGDAAPIAFGKVMSNFVFVVVQINTVSNLLGTNLNSLRYTVTNFIATNQFAKINGTNILFGTLNSNAVDSATWYAMTNGAGGGATMSFDGGTIISDGSGNVTIPTLTLTTLKDSAASYGGAGYWPRADGSGGWAWTAWPATVDYDGGLVSSDGSGNFVAQTVKSGLIDSGASSGTYGFMPVAMGDGTWTWMAGVTITNNFTNTTTVFDFTNHVLASKQIVAYTTNYAYWDRVSNGSNYLGRFQGIVDWSIGGGDNGGNPPTSMNMALYGSLTGTNSWFLLTNGYWTTNWISVAARTNGWNSALVGGSTIASPGSATIYTMDHWELHWRTNYFDYQKIRVNTQPTDDADLVNKRYVDALVANVKDGTFTSYTDTNNVFHFIYNRNNSTTFDLWNSISFVPMAYTGLDGTGTNMLINVMQTNLTSGFTFESSTNLALVNGYITWTNWTTNTVSGVTTFTVPLKLNEPKRFFRITKSASSGSVFNSAVAFNGGTIYPSNTWNIADLTNRLAAFGPGKHYWTGSSNGQSLVTLSFSNGVVRYIRAD